MYEYRYQKLFFLLFGCILNILSFHPNLHTNRCSLDCFKSKFILLCSSLLILWRHFFHHHYCLKILYSILGIIFCCNYPCIS
uniref:Uncharacterized protein n=1 Tax=Physcomitrium patens TaxID=3218 RepID=A0A2K1KB43_PHYPA|nr:hypothetical protein PHYPA_031209 [Physcomitrium patens]PNR50995.1 hypothetical protein PHYPA_010181 [Physcomitrium patens]